MTTVFQVSNPSKHNMLSFIYWSDFWLIKAETQILSLHTQKPNNILAGVCITVYLSTNFDNDQGHRWLELMPAISNYCIKTVT